MTTSTASLVINPIQKAKAQTKTSGGSIDIINPATGQVIGQQMCCAPEDVDQLVQSAHEAFCSNSWQSLTAADRGRLLLKLADLVERDSEKLIALELQDTGKPIAQLRNGEIPLTVAIIRFYAGGADKIEGRVKSTSDGTIKMTMFEPYGVVAGILPWNYPLVNAALKVAPATAAGNAIVLKPSVEAPLSTVAFAKLCIEAGLPEGIVSVVLGSGSKAGNALAGHRLVKKISFTGSTAVGQDLQRQAADQLKPVNLELGGKNAIIVFADADLERSAQAVLLSAFVNAGQLCVSCSRLLVEDSIADEFEALLLEKIAKINVGDPTDESTHIGPMIARSQYESVLEYLDNAEAEGCKVLCGGGKLELPPPHDKGFFLQPTILSQVRPGMKVADEEIFGPCLSVIRFKDEAEAIKIANGVEYGLSGSVWTSNQSRSLRVIKALDTGIIWANCMLVGYPQIPVSPHKMSGTGVELGMEGLMAYCKRKSAVIGYDEQTPLGWDL